MQEIIIKFCFLLLLYTMFRMKNIEILLNFEELPEAELVLKLKKIVLRA